MQARQYDFEIQHKIGQEGERFLDQWLRPIYKVSNVSEDSKYQQLGIDRVVTRSDGREVAFQVKTLYIGKL